MSEYVYLVAVGSAVINSVQATQHITPNALQTLVGTADSLLIKFEAMPAEYEYRAIRSVNLLAYGKTLRVGSNNLYTKAAKEPFNASSVTYAACPPLYQWTLSSDLYCLKFSSDIARRGGYLDSGKSDAIRNGVCLSFLSADDSVAIYTSEAPQEYKPVLSVSVEDYNNALQPTGNPQYGYVNPHKQITLKWSLEETNRSGSVATPVQTSAVVTWREVGSGSETSTTVTTAQQIALPADTWSAGTSYEWRVSVTDSGGSTTVSSWYTLSTTAASATPPTLQFPISTSVDGSENITFRWVNNGGENNTGTDLEFSTDGTTWGSPINVAAGVSEYTVTAGTLPSGTNYWRARAYNADSTAGSWTDATIFTVISSPQAPYYEVTNTPRPTITWVSDEQQAFQVQMGDYDSGLVFGTAQSFKCPVYLPNGSATVRVRVMNQYNLWSDWSGTQITIANTPGDAPPVLTVTAGVDAQLSWTDVEASRYLIYRDGELIGETTGLSFTDPYANGQASYFVRAEGARTTQTIALIDDYYINTNNPSGYVKIDSPTAAADTWSYAQVACQEGDRFLVTATGSNSYHLAYTFAKADKSKVAPTASANTGYTNEELTAPADAAWLVVNANMSNERSLKKITHQAADYYTDSATVSVTIAVPCPMICAMDGGWIELRYSTEPIYTSQETHTQQVSMMVWSGAVYPEAEIGPHRQRSYQIDVAFRPGESAPFEALLGREVFLKDQYGARLHGVMAAISTARNRFYTVCSATLEEMEGSL